MRVIHIFVNTFIICQLNAGEDPGSFILVSINVYELEHGTTVSFLLLTYFPEPLLWLAIQKIDQLCKCWGV